MATRIFNAVGTNNELAAHRAWCEDSTQSVFYDGAGRYAVGHLGALEEDLDHFMAPNAWEWLEVEEAFYDVDYLRGDILS